MISWFTRNYCACAPMLYISELCEDCAVANEIDYKLTMREPASMTTDTWSRDGVWCLTLTAYNQCQVALFRRAYEYRAILIWSWVSFEKLPPISLKLPPLSRLPLQMLNCNWFISSSVALVVSFVYICLALISHCLSLSCSISTTGFTDSTWLVLCMES